MWPFKKKKKQEVKIEFDEKCNHKWQDFSWVLCVEYYDRTLRVKIFEPYVCIYCKERKNMLIETTICKDISKKEANDIVEGIKEQYKDQLKPEAIVEDEINDFQLVDRQWLEYAYALRNSREKHLL